MNCDNIMATNYYGVFLLTNLLLPNLQANKARIVNVSSQAYEFANDIIVDNLFDIDYLSKLGGLERYSLSKLSINLFTHELNQRYGASGIVCTCLHPGFIITPIFDRGCSAALRLIITLLGLFAAKTFEQGSQTSHYCCIENVTPGGYYTDCKEFLSTPLSMNKVLGAELWEKTTKFLQL